MKPLHDKKHTLAKRFLSLLCILALCLGLLPVTALAADEIDLYVAGQRITESGCYANQNGTWKKVEGTGPSSGQFYYDAATATLTLNEAKIVNYQDVTVGGGFTYPGSVIAFSQSADVSLKIELQGDSTITGTGGIRVVSKAGDASLSISGPGSLEVNVDRNDSGISLIGSKNVNLNIDGADVKTLAAYYYGVDLHAGDGFKAAAVVNNGKLTAGGSGGIGIYYRWTNPSDSGTSSLTVSGNAVVDTRDSKILIASQASEVQVGAGSDGNGGIVFNGKSGTVYGDVTLQEDLAIGTDETLTIGKDASLTVLDGKTLTNDGTINVESGGKLEGTTTGNGTLKIAPTITTQPQDVEVKENETATFNVKVTGTEPLSYQWQQSTDKGQSWTDITGETNATYTIATTTMDMSGTQYRCVVTGSGVSVISSAATLTVNALTTYTINATVNPAEGGTVTVNGGETSATVTEGSEATLTATVNEGWRFAGWMENGQLVSNETTYTITANGNRTLTAEFEKVYNVTVNSTAGGTATADKTTAAEGETVTLTATPNSGYHFAGWNVVSGTVTIQDKQFIMPANDVDIQAIFARNTSPTIPPTVSEKTIDAIQDAQPGETVTVDLSRGSTKLDKEVFEELSGRDVTLVIELGDGLSWTVNGSDIPEDATLTDIDMGVTMNSDGIPVDVVNAITGEHGSVQLELAHNGAFGFTMTLTAPLGVENAGYWANLYHYDEDAEALNFEAAAKIEEDGSVTIPFSHASQYAIVIDTHSHATVDVSDLFIDIAPDAWYKDAIQYAYDNGLMTGVSATEFAPEQTTTRAMIVSILARLENVTTAEAAGFADVDDNEWYATAVNWAANVGVVNGYEDNTFQPNTAITREQLAAILMNYASYKGEDVSNRADLTSYTDQPSTWAQEAMQWAVAEGLISGVTNDQLQPQGNATRAQVAAILQRFLDK